MKMSQVYRCYIRRIHSYEKFNSPNPNPKKEREEGKKPGIHKNEETGRRKQQKTE